MKEQILDSMLRNKVVAILRNVDDDKVCPQQRRSTPVGSDFWRSHSTKMTPISSAARSNRSVGFAKHLRGECI